MYITASAQGLVTALLAEVLLMLGMLHNVLKIAGNEVH